MKVQVHAVPLFWAEQQNLLVVRLVLAVVQLEQLSVKAQEVPVEYR
jgi:hypothetical protein